MLETSPEKTAIIVVDMINDFVTGALKCEGASKIIPNIQRLLNFARKKKITIICMNDTHLPGIDEEFEVGPQYALVGTKGAEVIEELRPVKGDYVLQKRRYLAFFENLLESAPTRAQG